MPNKTEIRITRINKVRIPRECTITREGGLGRTTTLGAGGGRGGLLAVGTVEDEELETVEEEEVEEEGIEEGIQDAEVEEGMIGGAPFRSVGTEGEDFEEGMVVEFRGEGAADEEGDDEFEFEVRGVETGDGPGENRRGETRDSTAGSEDFDWNWLIFERIPELTPEAPRPPMAEFEFVEFAEFAAPDLAIGLRGFARGFIGTAGGLGTAYLNQN